MYRQTECMRCGDGPNEYGGLCKACFLNDLAEEIEDLKSDIEHTKKFYRDVAGHEYDDPKNMYEKTGGRQYHHIECHKKYMNGGNTCR